MFSKATTFKFRRGSSALSEQAIPENELDSNCWINMTIPGTGTGEEWKCHWKKICILGVKADIFSCFTSKHKWLHGMDLAAPEILVNLKCLQDRIVATGRHLHWRHPPHITWQQGGNLMPTFWKTGWQKILFLYFNNFFLFFRTMRSKMLKKRHSERNLNEKFSSLSRGRYFHTELYETHQENLSYLEKSNTQLV